MENTKNKLNVGLAIIVAAVIIGGAILLRGSKNTNNPKPAGNENPTVQGVVKGISADDFILGDKNAKIVMIEYADYQCPFCGKFFTETVQPIEKNYVDTGKIAFVYRDFTFLGEESQKAAEATRCASDQGKYWEYHDYLFTHQNGENEGAFADKNLKTFAKTLGLDSAQFDSCLDSGKYTQTVKDSSTEAGNAGVDSTPYTVIMKDGKVVDTVKGAYPLSEVTKKLDATIK